MRLHPLSFSLALAAACLAPAASFAVPPPSSAGMASFVSAAPPLVAAVASGSSKACAPVILTLSGNVASGSRIFVSAPVSEFSAELRKAARGKAKLSQKQSRRLQEVLDNAVSAQSSGYGFPAEALAQFSSDTGLLIEAEMLCASRETMSAARR